MDELDLVVLDGYDHSHMVDTLGALGRPKKQQVALTDIAKVDTPPFFGHMIRYPGKFDVVLAEGHVEQAGTVHALSGGAPVFIADARELQSGGDDGIGLGAFGVCPRRCGAGRYPGIGTGGPFFFGGNRYTSGLAIGPLLFGDTAGNQKQP